MKTTKKPKKISVSAKPKTLAKGHIKNMDIVDGSNSLQFCNRVYSLIQEGWQPYGEVFILNNNFCLAMVKR